MEKKEYYRLSLPHFQQPGQAYFMTWCLKDAVPPKALKYYTEKIQFLKAQLEQAKSNHADEYTLNSLSLDYNLMRKKQMKAFDDLLDLNEKSIVNLSNTVNRKIMFDALLFFEEKKLENYAFCIMPNHVHWVFRTLEKDENGKPVYLQDIMHSIKSFTANEINKNENRNGALWQVESYDTTIRNLKHLHNTIEYTLQNPVKAKLVKSVEEWEGTWVNDWD